MLSDTLIAAINVMGQDKDIYQCLSWGGQSSWGMLKEDIIKLASLPASANHGWKRILYEGEKMPHPDNRRYTAYGYRNLAIYAATAGRSFANPIYDLSAMLGRETDPQVLTEIIGCILEVLGLRIYSLSYEAEKHPETFAKFSQIIREHFAHISEVVAKSDELFGKPIRAILEIVGNFERRASI